MILYLFGKAILVVLVGGLILLVGLFVLYWVGIALYEVLARLLGWRRA